MDRLAKNKLLYLLSLIIFLGFAQVASAQAVAEDGGFHLRNNTDVTVTCSIFNTDNYKWFNITPGVSIPKFWPDQKSLLIVCAEPVRQKIYKLRPGQRYSMLMIGDKIEIRHIALNL